MKNENQKSKIKYYIEYSVKSYLGHNEGVLAVALDSNFLVSSDCEGFVKGKNEKKKKKNQIKRKHEINV